MPAISLPDNETRHRRIRLLSALDARRRRRIAGRIAVRSTVRAALEPRAAETFVAACPRCNRMCMWLAVRDPSEGSTASVDHCPCRPIQIPRPTPARHASRRGGRR